MNPLVLGPTVELVVSVKQRCDTAERRHNAQAAVAGERLIQTTAPDIKQLSVDTERSFRSQTDRRHRPWEGQDAAEAARSRRVAKTPRWQGDPSTFRGPGSFWHTATPEV